MLVVFDNKVHTNWTPGTPTGTLPYKGEIVISIDPSKSNFALLIGTGEPLELADFLNNNIPRSIVKTIEFSGNNRKRGPVMDTTLYCEEIRQFLYSYLKDARIKLVSVEQAITKRGASASHISNMALTEIRSNILNFFLEKFGIRVLEINNWAWKHAILPEGYRGQQQKGSKLWFQRYAPDSHFVSYFESDMTDCICVYLYTVLKFCSQQSLFCSTAEPKLNDYTYSFVPASLDTKRHYTTFQFNPKFSLVENLNYYANRTTSDFTLELTWDVPTLEDLYTKCGFMKWAAINEEKVKVVVCRS